MGVSGVAGLGIRRLWQLTAGLLSGSKVGALHVRNRGVQFIYAPLRGGGPMQPAAHELVGGRRVVPAAAARAAAPLRQRFHSTCTAHTARSACKDFVARRLFSAAGGLGELCKSTPARGLWHTARACAAVRPGLAVTGSRAHPLTPASRMCSSCNSWAISGFASCTVR